MTTSNTAQEKSLTEIKHYDGSDFDAAWKSLLAAVRNPINPSKRIELSVIPSGQIKVYTVV